MAAPDVDAVGERVTSQRGDAVGGAPAANGEHRPAEGDEDVAQERQTGDDQAGDCLLYTSDAADE